MVPRFLCLVSRGCRGGEWRWDPYTVSFFASAQIGDERWWWRLRRCFINLCAWKCRVKGLGKKYCRSTNEIIFGSLLVHSVHIRRKTGLIRCFTGLDWWENEGGGGLRVYKYERGQDGGRSEWKKRWYNRKTRVKPFATSDCTYEKYLHTAEGRRGGCLCKGEIESDEWGERKRRWSDRR